MDGMLLTEHQFEFLSLKGDCTVSLSLHLSKCHIVGKLMLHLIDFFLADNYQDLTSILTSFSAISDKVKGKLAVKLSDNYQDLTSILTSFSAISDKLKVSLLQHNQIITKI